MLLYIQLLNAITQGVFMKQVDPDSTQCHQLSESQVACFILRHINLNLILKLN